MTALALRAAPNCECAACRRFTDALADLEAASRERRRPERVHRDGSEGYPGGALSRELRHAAAAMDRAHVGSLSVQPVYEPERGRHAEGGSAPSRRRESELEQARGRSSALIGGPSCRDHEERQGEAVDEEPTKREELR